MARKPVQEHKTRTPELLKQQSGRSFAEQLNDGGETPANLMLTKMRDGRVPLAHRLQIAEKLMPYSVPKINPVDAQDANVEVTHEEWLDRMDAAAEKLDAEREEDDGI